MSRARRTVLSLRVRLVREDGGRPKFWQVAVRCISLYLILLAAPWAGFGAWNGMIDACLLYTSRCV